MRTATKTLLLLLPASFAFAERRAMPVARLSYVEGAVERSDSAKSWKRVEEGAQVRTGDRIRTGADGLARLAFPWMAVTAAPGTILGIPSGAILATQLEEGRAELAAGEGEIIKLRTSEAEIRGEGRVIVRRYRGVTLVTAREGNFRVIGGGRTVVVFKGNATVVRPGEAPQPPGRAPEPPGRVVPGADPVYVLPGQAVELSWVPAGTAHHLQVLGIDSEDALIERDVGASPQSLQIPWLGTFRWRVAARNAEGLEGLPSTEGLICVVEK